MDIDYSVYWEKYSACFNPADRTLTIKFAEGQPLHISVQDVEVYNEMLATPRNSDIRRVSNPKDL